MKNPIATLIQYFVSLASDTIVGNNPLTARAVADHDSQPIIVIPEHTKPKINSINSTTYDGVTALWLAVFTNDRESVVRLIKQGADVNLAPTAGIHKGKSPLWLACSPSGDYGLIHLLLEHGADPNIYPTDGKHANETAFYSLAIQTRFPVAVELVKYGADVNIMPAGLNGHETPFWHGLCMKEFEFAALLLKRNPKLANSMDRNFTPLQYLFRYTLDRNLDDVFKFAALLIQKGADINAQSTSDKDQGKTALCFAAEQGCCRSVNFLLKHGADPKLGRSNSSGIVETPLWIAILEKKYEIASCLLDATDKVDLNMGWFHGETPLQKLLWYSPSDEQMKTRDNLVQRLIHKGANVNFVSDILEYNLAPIIISVLKNDFDLVKLLIDRDANVNACSKRNYLGDTVDITPLSAAVQNENPKIAKLLLESGADPNFKFASNYAENGFTTCLYWAVVKDNQPMAELLLAHGANLADLVTNFPDFRDEKVLEWLTKLANRIVVDLPVLALVVKDLRRYSLIAERELDQHDIVAANATYDEIEKYFKNKNILIAPGNPYLALRVIIMQRIKNDPKSSEAIRNFLRQSSKAMTLRDFPQDLFDEHNIEHKAYKWMITFEKSMLLYNSTDANSAAAQALMKKMFAAIVACRRDLLSSTEYRYQAPMFEDILMMQLGNALDANEGEMSCVQGTPRFLRVVLHAYLNILEPQQERRLDLAVANVIDKVLRDYFKQVLEGKDCIKDWEFLNQQLISACEAFADFGLDRANAMLNGEAVHGRVTDTTFDATKLKLRNEIFYATYKTFDSFVKAVADNLKAMQKKSKFSLFEKLYLMTMYLAISNNFIRKRLYESLDCQKNALYQQREMQLAPQKLTEFIGHFKANPTDKNRRDLLNQLVRIGKHLAGDRYNLAAITSTASGIVAKVDDTGVEEIMAQLHQHSKPTGALRPMPR